MTNQRNDKTAAARLIAEHVAQQLPAVIESETTRIYNSVYGNFEAMTKQVGDDLARRFADGVQVVSKKAIEDMQQASAQAEQRADEIRKELASLTDDARDATSTARAEIEKAAQEKAEAEAMLEKARQERDEADKAIALMRLQGDIEIERMTKTASFTAHEKATLQQLKNQRAEMEDDFDRKSDAITAGIQRYYPELSEQLDQIVENYRKQEEGE